MSNLSLASLNAIGAAYASALVSAESNEAYKAFAPTVRACYAQTDSDVQPLLQAVADGFMSARDPQWDASAVAGRLQTINKVGVSLNRERVKSGESLVPTFKVSVKKSKVDATLYAVVVPVIEQTPDADKVAFGGLMAAANAMLRAAKCGPARQYADHAMSHATSDAAVATLALFELDFARTAREHGFEIDPE